MRLREMLTEDRARGLSILKEIAGVTDSVILKLEIFEKLLRKWQKVQNLVSRETIDSFWLRHVCDSARLSMIVTGPAQWLDFGSGAGFPGLVSAILQDEMMEDRSRSHVYLVESNGRKVAFLRSVIRETGIRAEVFDERMEEVAGREDLFAPNISARAVAPLDKLLSLSAPQTARGARCFFHKGRDIDAEIIEAANNWRFDLIKHDARISDNLPTDGIILEIRNISRKN